MVFTDHPQDLRGFSATECTGFQQEYRNLFRNRFPQHLRTHSGAFKQTGPKENGRKGGGGRNLWKSALCGLYRPWNTFPTAILCGSAQALLHVEQLAFHSECGRWVGGSRESKRGVPQAGSCTQILDVRPEPRRFEQEVTEEAEGAALDSSAVSAFLLLSLFFRRSLHE